jgi:predicted O-linked N-acetylglucosamine transferase (SPINDLY family)
MYSTLDYTLNVKYEELLDLTVSGYSAKFLFPSRSRSSDKIRLGFLSSFFFRHSVGKLLGNVIVGLSKSVFEIFVIELAGGASQTGFILL